jgi:GT2 family glycosyltransferase
MPEISTIVVTYNSASCIENCLDSFYAQGFDDCEVIVVDNGSQDNTVSLIKCKYPGIILIENAQNYGACRARNQGILRSQGEFVVFLDHDVKLTGHFLSTMLEGIKKEDNISSVGPKILNADGKTIYSAGLHISFLRRIHDIGKGQVSGGYLDQERLVFGLSLAAALFRRKALEDIKWQGEYFDDDFFYFFEDADISWRLQKKGWRALYAPAAVCFHSAGGSRRRDGISRFFCLRNRYLLLLKNESLAGFLSLFFVFFIYDLWRNIFVMLMGPKYFFRALIGVGKLTPKMLKKRS